MIYGSRKNVELFEKFKKSLLKQMFFKSWKLGN